MVTVVSRGFSGAIVWVSFKAPLLAKPSCPVQYASVPILQCFKIMVWPTSVLAFCIALVSASTTSPAVCAPPTIVSTDQSPSLLPNIILGDYGSVEPDLPAPVRRRKSPAVRLDQRGIGSSQLSPWSTAVANGRTLWASLQKVLNDRTAVDTSTCDIDTRWQMWVNLDRPGYLDFSWETVNPPADLAQQKLAWYRASIKFPRGLRPSYYTHVSRYSIEYKAILAELTFGKGSSHPEAPATVPDHCMFRHCFRRLVPRRTIKSFVWWLT